MRVVISLYDKAIDAWHIDEIPYVPRRSDILNIDGKVVHVVDTLYTRKQAKPKSQNVANSATWIERTLKVFVVDE